MKFHPLCGIAFFFGAAIVVLSGCARTLTPPLQATGASAVAHKPDAHEYKVLHSFAGTPDGQNPVEITGLGGSLYAGTFAGGTANFGAIFRLTLSGKESIVYSFRGGTDGWEPSSGLTEFHGSRYGVTYWGGGIGCRSGSGCGTIYALDPSGNERIVYRFKPNDTDGWFPNTTLVPMNGLLFGATAFGYEKTCGSYGCGRVYSLDATGKERVIYRFKGGADGCWPTGLVAVKGVLYGITQNGGTGSGCGSTGGIAFALTATGKETVLHRFKDTPDGSMPNSLMVANGTLYGTTYYGGSSTCEGGGRPCGTVFSLTRSGREKVLYRFQGYSDGAGPNSVVMFDHTLYGTTGSGGGGSGLGNGTIFSLTTAGVKNTLYAFKAAPDGLNPGQLIDLQGTLYGVTGQGGTGKACSFGCGTVYKIAP